MSQKVSCASRIIDLVINGFNPNDESSRLHNCDHSIVTLGIRKQCLGFSNTSHVDSLDRFRRTVVDKVKIDICMLKQKYHSKENNTKIQYKNEFVEQLGMGDPTTCVYQFIYDEKDSFGTEIIQYFIMHGLGLYIKVDSYVAHMLYAYSFSHNTTVPINKKNKKYLLSLNTNTTAFASGYGNPNKN